jgi:hypothetical protein
MPREILYLPPPPQYPNGDRMGPDARSSYSGYYLVTQQDEVLSAYNSIYYRSTNHIVADLLDRVNREDVSDIWGEDYVIWRDGRVMAAIHQRRNDEAKNVTLFNDPGNDPGAAHHSPLPGWPTYEQWVESSKGPLWYDPSNYQNSAR